MSVTSPSTVENIGDSSERWPVRTSAKKYSGGVIALRSDEVRSPVDDDVFVRDVVEHPGAVAIVALDDDDRVLVVKQYRHPVGARLVEIPAGLRDVEGEPPHEAAARELYEEGHIRAKDWRVLLDALTSPGMTDEAIRVYLARGITSVANDERFVGGQEEADMSVEWVPLDVMVNAVLSGAIHNAVTCAGVLAVHAARSGEGYDSLRQVDSPWLWR